MRWVIVCLQSSCLPVLCSNTSTLELIPIDDYVRKSPFKPQDIAQPSKAKVTGDKSESARTHLAYSATHMMMSRRREGRVIWCCPRCQTLIIMYMLEYIYIAGTITTNGCRR